MTETLLIDLKDDLQPDNRRFFNLLDDSRWRALLQDAQEAGAVLSTLLEDLIDGN